MKLSIITLVNKPEIYIKNVMKSTSPYIRENKIEYIVINKAKTASSGLNKGIQKANNDVIICCHQDVEFLDGWYDKFKQLINTLDNRHLQNEVIWGVVGFAGTTKEGLMVGTHSGLEMNNNDIVEVQTLDCSTLVFRKSTFQKYNLKFDENLQYFHMYGEDISLQCLDKELKVYCLNVPIKHNTIWSSGGGFQESTNVIKKKWGHRFKTIFTTVGQI